MSTEPVSPAEEHRPGAGLARMRAALGLPEPSDDPDLIREVQRRLAAADDHAKRVYRDANAA